MSMVGEERNTVDKINEQFYEDLKKLSSVSQKSEKQEKYEYARQQLIRLYTVAGKPRIDDMPDRVKWLINTLDKLISTEAKRNADPGKKSRIMEIAEWEVKDPNDKTKTEKKQFLIVKKIYK